MTFKETGLSAHLLTTLEKEGFSVPTPIQMQAIPRIRAGLNVVGVAHTGTGKTLAFALPLMDKLQEHEGIALILVPTRELALQLEKRIRKVAKGLTKMKPSVLISGIPIKRQVESLSTQPRIIIATPGRLNEHLDIRTINLDAVTIVVLDEADRMLNSGFAPQIERILARSPKNRQTLMFSATMSPSLTRLITRYAPQAVHITIATEPKDTSLIDQSICHIGPTRRTALLTKLLHKNKGSALVFAATKHGAQNIFHSLEGTGLKVTSLHSNLGPNLRAEAMDGLRKGRYNVLVTTDVSARGLDIPTISLVVNYDVPVDAETYLHRVGRTGRAGKPGRAITFVTPEQTKILKKIEYDLGVEFLVLGKE